MIEVVFSEEEAVGVGQGKKVTIIPDIKSAGDRSGELVGSRARD